MRWSFGASLCRVSATTDHTAFSSRMFGFVRDTSMAPSGTGRDTTAASFSAPLLRSAVRRTAVTRSAASSTAALG